MNIKKLIPLILSYSRIIVTPLIILLILHHYFLEAFVIFLIAAVTDSIDGFWARRFNVVTKHGAYIDPLADKILILGMLATFAYLGSLPFWAFVIIALREIGITMLRSWCEMKGKRFVTAWHGKYKTILQMILIAALFGYHGQMISAQTIFVLSCSVALYSCISGLAYVRTNLSRKL